jgi:hypothetical protein
MDRSKQSPVRPEAQKLSAAELAARHPRAKPLAQSQLVYGSGVWAQLLNWLNRGYPKG